jgi:hypothetical protein
VKEFKEYGILVDCMELDLCWSCHFDPEVFKVQYFWIQDYCELKYYIWVNLQVRIGGVDANRNYIYV